MTAAPGELLMFEVGGRVYGAAARDVRRIGDLRSVSPGDVLSTSALGEPRALRRGLVVDCGPGGERTLAVDEVLGFRRVAEADFRPLPAFAAACLARRAVAGLALLEAQPTVVVDLRALVSGA